MYTGKPFGHAKKYEYKSNVHLTKLDDAGILTITFNRPEKRNAINHEFENDLYNMLGTAEDDEKVRAVILNANGPCWSSGHDLLESAEEIVNFKVENGEAKTFDAAGYQGEWWDRTGRILPSWRFSKPLICSIHGYVGPHANTLLVAADYVVAADNTRISFEEARLGVGAPWGSYMFLALYFPMRVMQNLWMGGWMDADTARHFHYVNRVVPLGEQDELAYRYAKQAIAMDTADFRATKMGVRKLYEVMMDVRNAEEVGYLMYEKPPERREAIRDHLRTLLEKGMKATVEDRDQGYDPDLAKI